MKHWKAASAALISMGLMAQAAQAAAPLCTTQGELSSLRTAALQQQLMVAGLTCRASEAYNRFVLAYRPELQKSDAELKARADAILIRFHSGEKFEDLAKEYSQDLHRSKGGDWGEMKRTQLIPEFGDAVFKLKKQEATDPIVYQHGVYILYVSDRRYAGIQPLKEVRPNIERILQSKMQQDSMEHWLERLRRNGYIKHF